MKTLCIVLFTLTSGIVSWTWQDTSTVKAVFDGQEEGMYYFTGEDFNSYAFQGIEEGASEKYDLSNEEFVGQTFNVTYKVETETDEFDDEYEVYIIVDLELVE